MTRGQPIGMVSSLHWAWEHLHAGMHASVVATRTGPLKRARACGCGGVVCFSAWDFGKLLTLKLVNIIVLYIVKRYVPMAKVGHPIDAGILAVVAATALAPCISFHSFALTCCS